MSNHYRYEFQDGTLTLACLRGKGVYRIEPWPRPRSLVRLLPDAPWIPCPPPIRLVQAASRPPRELPPCEQLEFEFEGRSAQSPAQSRLRALQAFRASLPPAVAQGAEPFRELQWEILVGCSHSTRFIDILTNNPALAFLWLSHCKSRGFCQEGAADLLAARMTQGGETSQRQLLRHLGFLESKAAVKLLRKCQPATLQAENVRSLHTILSDPRRLRRLAHLPRLGTGIFQIARSTRILGACRPALLSEVATCRDEVHRAPTAERIAQHLAVLNELGMPLPRLFLSREDLLQRHRELVEGFHDLRRELEANVAPPPPLPAPRPRTHRAPPPAPAPAAPAAQEAAPKKSPARRKSLSCGPPPLPGDQYIVPLTTRAELEAEGREQSNCVGSYFISVRKGWHYIYKVLWPQRCTASITKNRQGRWIRSELKTARNRGTRAITKRHVDAWIQRHQPASPAGP